MARNRIMLATHGPRLGQARYLRYLEERARGGIGLAGLNLGPLGVMQFPLGPGAAESAGELDGVPPHPLTAEGKAAYDSMIPAVRGWAEALTTHGVVAVAQLYHPGAAQHTDNFQPVISASPTADEYERHNPHALTVQEIGDLTEAYSLGARRALEARYDVIELHAAHGYLPQQFLSPRHNSRTDQYGGSLHNRLRFLLDLIKATRDGVAGEIPIGVRLTGPESEGGLDLGAIVDIARAIEAAGGAYISISGGTYSGLSHGVELPYVAPAFVKPGPNVPTASAVKQAVSIPVMVTGAIATLDQAETIVAGGHADVVGMVRALMADPRLVAKGFAGAGERVAPCIGGNECHYGRPVACAVNPRTGREAAMALTPAKRPRRILVIGGGPAGLECATAAAQRGHQVTLADRSDQLGGFLVHLARVSEQARFAQYLDYASGAARDAGVEVQLGAEVDEAYVRDWRPDAVVLATGATWSMGGRRGYLTAAEAVRDLSLVGRHVAVVGGLDDHLPPLVMADYLARQGRKVTLLSELPLAGQAIESASLYILLRRLMEGGVDIRTTTAGEAFDRRALTLRNSFTNKKTVLEDVDTVIAIDGRVPNDGLAAKIAELAPEVHIIGDALSPRRMLHATLDGARLGLTGLD